MTSLELVIKLLIIARTILVFQFFAHWLFTLLENTQYLSDGILVKSWNVFRLNEVCGCCTGKAVCIVWNLTQMLLVGMKSPWNRHASLSLLSLALQDN